MAAPSTSTTRSAREDRLTQAVTLFALLEMHKKGEATWEQREVFGPIEITGRTAAASSRAGGE